MQVDSAYTVLLREKKLPMALLEDPESKRAGKAVRASLVQTQPFAQTFGAKQTRKRPRLSSETYSDMLGHAAHHSARCVSQPSLSMPAGHLSGSLGASLIDAETILRMGLVYTGMSRSRVRRLMISLRGRRRERERRALTRVSPRESGGSCTKWLTHQMW